MHSLALPQLSFIMADKCKKLPAFHLKLLFLFSLYVLSKGNDDIDLNVYAPGTQQDVKYGAAKPMRYLLYEVNPGEGFNLRRDVYMRVANLVYKLNEDQPWTLVLPPWGRLYHWRSAVEQSQIPWKTFFDLQSLSRHVPVIEFEDFLKVSGKREIEEIYYLQKYKEGWKDGKWEEKMDMRDCIERTGFMEDLTEGVWRWWFWGFDEVYGKKFQCVSIQAQYTFLREFLNEKTSAKSVFLVRAEELIHGDHSEWSTLFWDARRSMRFAEHLRSIGDGFRKTYLDSDDERDNTILDDNWKNMRRKHGEAIGGPYLAVHLRRRDFLYGHKDDVPSIAGTAEQIEKVLQKFKLDIVFVATDAPKEEYEELKKLLSKHSVYRYEPTTEILENYKDGGVAIIDQWICAHARYFMGTSVSTFTFRINEEREILGFEPKMTFNRFCGDSQENCEQPTKWTIKYNTQDERRAFINDEL